MLKAILLSAVLLCAVIRPVKLDSHYEEVVTSRPETLRKIDGDTMERRLYLEQCTQSSLHASCIFAIDDEINQESWSNECAVTNADLTPWWEARLENPAFVSKVQIYGLKNIAERGFDALTDFQLLISDHVCINYKSYSSFTNKTFACDTFGETVRIQSSRPLSLLAICEVVAYGKYVTLDRKDKGNTLLPYRSCMMSGGSGGNCHLALDGNLEQEKASKCAESEIGDWNPSITVLLTVPSLIHRIVIYNRGDLYQEKLNSFEITVNGQLCVRYDSNAAFSKEEFFCGRYGTRVQLKVTKSGKENRLVLCELQLFGYMTKFLELRHREYVGCFREKRNNRDLQKMVAMENMSEEKCERMCRRLKKPYFGLQRGQQCWCSERYGIYGEVSRKDCWMKCDGDPRQGCGAKLVNSVYKIT